ncbi:MAG: hypothetical protein V2I76_06410 [Roseobacter sp.]|nr:hypothetical protein [Roseobacter sp.]
MRRRDIISMYSSGLCELALTCLGIAIAGLILLQLVSIVTGVQINADGALAFSWQIAMLMGLWPGQTFWTIRRTTPNGLEHSIIGVPSDDDLRIHNRQTAQRICRQLRD